MRDLANIQSLVGSITERDLKDVDSYVCDDLGIFIPSTGFCGYAVQKGHTHPSYSFVILLNNSDSVVKTGLSPDENNYAAAMLPPDIPHEETMQDEFVRYIAIMASKPLTETVCANLGIALPCMQDWHPFFVPREVMLLISRFLEEYEANVCGGTSVLHAVGFLILTDLLRHACSVSFGHSLPKSAVIRSCVETMHQCFSTPVSVQDFARQARLSTSSFSRRFTRETGFTPAAYLLRIRLKNAKKLLLTSENSITEIAQQCAFSSAAHLSYSFKKQYGFSPSEYRKLYANI